MYNISQDSYDKRFAISFSCITTFYCDRAKFASRTDYFR